ncbi:hypothetical protein P168DRAFT_266033 [Aspergillus campestris IBT 28561]|uniref:TRAF-like signal transducer n=1 Tax=Aspergillus campestris (strain IBT 28561) TaxID=1392248 RepID=A0A2I1D6I4_ASPC2|nr:uncharacterized protein P168DRAFT_266033 [Aspergillus campestris IBT 28561]PKY05491.1 hypothetical protein P168DRAFT_266033 [Aspergillus campestris IBT 28561]
MDPPNDNEVVDLRSLDYVSRYDDHLMCAICHCPFIRPIRLQCDHVFCQKCLNTAITSFAGFRDDFTCPSCRTPTKGVYLNVPRLLINMCDDIRVKCPFAVEGCEEVMPRGHVQSHVDKYCNYRLVDCPNDQCGNKTRKMDLHPEKCMHALHTCQHCGDDIMEKDYEEHVQESCPSLETTCPDCQTTVLQQEFEEHVKACPEMNHPCAASKFGCPVKVTRSELAAHEQGCPLVMMGPYLDAQNSRLGSLESTVRHLQQRNEIYEDGLSNIRSTLFESSRGIPERDPNLPQESLNEGRLSGAPEQPENDQWIDLPNVYSTNANTYLLSLHESLREEVGQLSRAITDLDARASMAIMNECLRIKEDMAHTNAAVSSIRMQVQWLMNPRLHQAQRMAGARNSNNGNGNTHDGDDTATAGPSNAAGPSPGLLRPRRLSDGGREGTKL